MSKLEDYRHTKEELEKFINELNFQIQYLGLRQHEMNIILNRIFKEGI